MKGLPWLQTWSRQHVSHLPCNIPAAAKDPEVPDAAFLKSLVGLLAVDEQSAAEKVRENFDSSIRKKKPVKPAPNAKFNIKACADPSFLHSSG